MAAAINDENIVSTKNQFTTLETTNIRSLMLSRMEHDRTWDNQLGMKLMVAQLEEKYIHTHTYICIYIRQRPPSRNSFSIDPI